MEGGFGQETFVFVGIDKLGSQARREMVELDRSKRQVKEDAGTEDGANVPSWPPHSGLALLTTLGLQHSHPAKFYGTFIILVLILSNIF